ncbi:hypothetical protein L9F63_001543 [Diploptera punctata]|uniref:Membrane-bound transcription factor site-2 protease n=1 Tax=Diploptera punctata TaxID=6984 RepID=A0AAD8EJ06_DIPPU|nr:hypothetical protein L9F63_001543 [Diploptera punctata]
MDSLTFLIVVSLIHCALIFFDTLFKSCSHYPYLYFLHNTGLQVQVFQVRWFTTAFNRLIQKCGSWRPSFLDLWFSFGSTCCLLLLPLAVYVVVKTAMDAWQTESQTNSGKSTFILEPMVPGLNLPLSDIGYYVTTLVICSTVHELGHAVAAVSSREDVHVSGIGVTVLLIVPVLYVHLNTEQYDALAARRQLRVICAGVWHNFMLAAMTLLILILLPTLLTPFYEIGSGVVVQSIDQISPLLGPTGLLVGDKIVSINQHHVKDYDSWHYSISSAIKTTSPGYCISSELVRLHDESVSVRQSPGGVIECCSASSTHHLCFEYLDKDENMPELPQHSCLPGRVVIESTQQLCIKGSDCSLDRHCLKPLLTNQTRLLRIQRDKGKVVIFVGHPNEIYHTVKVSEFVPKYVLIPSLIAEVLMKLCKYVILFSSGLGVVNIIPCFYFDGQHIVKAVCNAFLARKYKKSVRQAIAFTVTSLGTLLLFSIFLALIFAAVF